MPCFLVEHPTAGHFLIDTGLPPAASHDVRAALGRRAGIAYDIRMEDGWGSPIGCRRSASIRWASSWSC